MAQEASLCIGEVAFNTPADVTLNPDAYALPSYTQPPPKHNDFRGSEDLQTAEATYLRPWGEFYVVNSTPTPNTTEFGEPAERRHGTSPSFESPHPDESGGGGQFSTFQVRTRINGRQRARPTPTTRRIREQTDTDTDDQR
ncbi:hypothetical protein M422DRAFT_43209 [Sphaerobolus stellatus SS14]|nr:hypothetical protein M422DRAFT_43209 [Sphaerobolus stellatus SS14]